MLGLWSVQWIYHSCSLCCVVEASMMRSQQTCTSHHNICEVIDPYVWGAVYSRRIINLVTVIVILQAVLLLAIYIVIDYNYDKFIGLLVTLTFSEWVGLMFYHLEVSSSVFYIKYETLVSKKFSLFNSCFFTL